MAKILDRPVTINISNDVYNKIQKFLKQCKYNANISEFIRIAIDNQIKTIEKNRSSYRITFDDNGEDIIEIDYLCKECGTTDIIYIRQQPISPEDFKKKARLIFDEPFDGEGE